MKPIRAALLGLGLAAPAWAQHGATGGGHAVSPHAGAGVSSSRGFSMAVPAAPSRSFSAPGYRPGLQTSRGEIRPGYSSARPGYSSPIGSPPFGATQPPRGHRHPYSGGGYRPSYYSQSVYAVPGFLNYGFGYPDDSFYGDQPQQPAPDSYAQAAPSDPGYGAEGEYDQTYGQAPPRYGYPQSSAPAVAEAAPDQPGVTLLFKDGRPAQQVQNYAVTRTTLYVLDGAKRREIPLDDLDLPQTRKTNRDAGVDFTVPVGAE